MIKILPIAVLIAAPACAQDAAHDLAQGQDIFTTICADCHGLDARGLDEAPNIRSMSRRSIASAIKGFDAMPEIDLDSAQIDALAAYLDTLPAD